MLQVPATDGTLARGVWRRWCFSILYNSPFNLGNNSKHAMIRHSLQLYLHLWLKEYCSSSPHYADQSCKAVRGTAPAHFHWLLERYNKPFGMLMPQTMGRRTNSKGIKSPSANSCVCFSKHTLVDAQCAGLILTWIPLIAVLFWTTMSWKCRGPLAKSFKRTFLLGIWECHRIADACYSWKHTGACWIINHQQGKLSKI